MINSRVTGNEVNQIIHLLRDTDLPITIIAKRMQLSTSKINVINKKYSIRKYEGKRASFKLD